MESTPATPGTVLQLRPDDPVLHRAQIGGALELVAQALAFGRQIGAVALPAGLAVLHGRAAVGSPIVDRPHVDLAEAGGDRPHARLDAGRQVRLGLRQALATCWRAK